MDYSGDCMTVTGKTLEENLDHIKLNDTHFLCTDILKQPPIKNDSHIRIFHGNWQKMVQLER